MKRRSIRRGFTLLELMIAMSAGLMVAAAAYALSKNALETFQQESRGFAAQFSAMNGMTRLVADVRRAGFMTSPNLQNDPFRCGDVLAAHQRRLSAITTVQGDSGAYLNDAAIAGGPDYDAFPSQYAANNRYPDRIRLVGNYATTEVFDVATYDITDGGTMLLQTDSPAVARVYAETKSGGAEICDMFVRNRLAATTRYAAITTATGQTSVIRVTGCGQNPTGANDNYDNVTLTFVMNDVQTSTRCYEAPKTIAPIMVVEYFLAHVDDLAEANAIGLDPSMVPLTAPQAPAVTGDADNGTNAAVTQGRMELIRREIDALGVPVPNSAEIVAEYVVDMKFAYRSLSGPPPAVPGYLDFGTSDIDPGSGTANLRPEHLRSILVRLSTRARTPDRDDPGDLGIAAENDPIRRFAALPGPSPRVRFARVRTVTTEVALPNLANVVW